MAASDSIVLAPHKLKKTGYAGKWPHNRGRMKGREFLIQ